MHATLQLFKPQQGQATPVYATSVRRPRLDFSWTGLKLLQNPPSVI